MDKKAQPYSWLNTRAFFISATILSWATNGPQIPISSKK